MRTLVHLSDLHFGNSFDHMVEPVVAAVAALRPDLTIVSGDFVEHAKTREFLDARAFLDRLPKPQLVIAGNHDLAFYDPRRRLLEGLKRYRKYIAEETEPAFSDDELIVVGVNTPRKIPIKGGRINLRQMRRIEQLTCGGGNDKTRILVTHHPLDLPGIFKPATLAGRSDAAMEMLSPCLDLMLAGHIHLSSTGASATRYRRTGHSVVFAQAGTAISRRNKGEPNSFNLLRIAKDRIEIQHQTWNEAAGRFEGRPAEHFEHAAAGWSKVVSPQIAEQLQR